MQSQRSAVYVSVCQVLNVTDINELTTLSKEQRKEVIELVTTSISIFETEFSESARAKYDTFDKIKGYVNGMVSNWLRKDVRLNGGDKYETKNPGSRAGGGDEILKNLKALKSTLTDDIHIQAVEGEISKRQAELSKKKIVEVDLSKIPDELRKQLGLDEVA